MSPHLFSVVEKRWGEQTKETAGLLCRREDTNRKVWDTLGDAMPKGNLIIRNTGFLNLITKITVS